MKTLWIETQFPYDGTQLRSLYGYMTHRILGDSIVAWRGPCEIHFDHMVDGEDVLAGAEIRGDDMVHFILEKFHEHLSLGVALQRVMASLVIDTLRELSPKRELLGRLRREGDDVYVEHRKFSISIATVSPVSTLVHFAVNVSNQGTPVPTIALEDFTTEPVAFARALMEKVNREVISIEEATRKVRWVK